MGSRLRIGIGVCIFATLAALHPAVSASPRRSGEVIARLPDMVPRGAVLPDAENRLLAMLNHERRAHGLSSLTVDPSVRSAARHHAQDMAVHGYVGHGSLDGETLRDRAKRFAFHGTQIGENVAMAQTVEQGHRAFVASHAHFRNMLDPAFHRVGIGVVTVGDMGVMITEDFVDG